MNPPHRLADLREAEGVRREAERMSTEEILLSFGDWLDKKTGVIKADSWENYVEMFIAERHSGQEKDEK